MRGCWEARDSDTPDDGLGLFATHDARPAVPTDRVEAARTPEALPRRLVEAPAVAPTRHLTALSDRRSAEPEQRQHVDQRTVR